MTAQCCVRGGSGEAVSGDEAEIVASSARCRKSGICRAVRWADPCSIVFDYADLLITDPLERQRRRQCRALSWRQDAADAQMVRMAGRRFQPKRADETAKPTAASNQAVSIK